MDEDELHDIERDERRLLRERAWSEDEDVYDDAYEQTVKDHYQFIVRDGLCS